MRIVAQYADTNPLPTAFCHGPTLLPQPGGGVLGAWFGGTEEGRPDSGIYIARLAAGARAWASPQLVVPPDGRPCGNPVLFEGAPGELWLVYFRVRGEWCTDGRPCARLSPAGGRGGRRWCSSIAPAYSRRTSRCALETDCCCLCMIRSSGRQGVRGSTCPGVERIGASMRWPSA